MESIPARAGAARNDEGLGAGGSGTGSERCGFQMPLHYPRYTKAEYEVMPEWKLDCLLAQYGLPLPQPALASGGDRVQQKRKFAMGTFLWQ